MPHFNIGDVVACKRECRLVGKRGMVTAPENRHGMYRIDFPTDAVLLREDEMELVSDEELFGVEIPAVGSQWIDSLGSTFSVVRVLPDLTIVRQYKDELWEIENPLWAFARWVGSGTITPVTP